MNTKELINYCLTKQGAYLAYPFDENYPVVKIKSQKSNKERIFAEFYTLNGKEIMTFSTDNDTALTLRMEFDGIIVSGWHCPPVQAQYKSTAYIEELPEDLLVELIDMSYDRAVQKLR